MLIKVQFISQAVGSALHHQDWVYGVLPHRLPTEDLIQLTKSRREGLSDAAVDILPDFLFHQRGSHHDIPEAALVDFVNIEHHNVQQALDYFLKYGIFDKENLRLGSHYPEKVRTFWKDSLADGWTPYAQPLGVFWVEHWEISNLLTVSRGLSDNNPSSVRKACKNLLATELDTRAFKRDWTQYGKAVISERLTFRLRHAKLGIAEEKGKLVVATAPYGLRSALYLQLITCVTERTPLTECENWKCRKVFVISRPGKKFCSPQCQSVTKVRRFRDHQKQESSKNKIQKEGRR
jgi:hypothetical protein